MIKMIVYLSLFTIFSMTGCASVKMAGMPSDPRAQPVPVAMPFKVDLVRMYNPSSKTFIETPIDSLTKEQIRKLLSNSSSKMTIEKKDINGQFNYIALGSTLQKGEYKITYDFTNSFNQSFELREGVETIGEFGVGVRLVAEIKTNSKSVNVSGLIPLAVGAKNNKLSGSIKYNTYGIRHPKINTAAPATLNLTEESIQKVFDAIAVARVLVDLDETTLEPNLLAYIPKE